VTEHPDEDKTAVAIIQRVDTALRLGAIVRLPALGGVQDDAGERLALVLDIFDDGDALVTALQRQTPTNALNDDQPSQSDASGQWVALQPEDCARIAPDEGDCIAAECATDTPLTPLMLRPQRTQVIERAALATLDAVATVKPEALARILRARVRSETRRFYDVFHAPKPFQPGETFVPYAARVFDHHEVEAAVDASLDFWLTLGEHGLKFERGLAKFLGVRHSVLVNSGSSANLLAFSTLTSPKLGKRRIKPGDEVITVAAGFPTTVNPIIQNGCVPVFIDCDPTTANARVEQLEAALSPRTRAVMMAHTLGNPFDIDPVVEFCKRNGLWLIEDNCDALGSRYKGKLTGTFGDLSTQSFYPPHHLTMGEGGAVNCVRSPLLKKLVESYRDWGRDCWCESGKADTCGKRFKWELGELPEAYDHKYIYSHIGYNLKPLDIQAAIGRQQLDKLPGFVEARRRNWSRLYQGIAPYAEFLDLPQATPGAEPSWFGFLLLVRPDAPFARRDIVAHIEGRNVQTRMLFGGNLTRQPAYLTAEPHGDHPLFRTIGDLPGADRMMNEAFFLGVYPGLTDQQIDYMVDTVATFIDAL
jgi:CDP-4-dehydro-6-deoxyglucose reductase, E1